MELQVKLFSWQDIGNHLIVLARGLLDAPAFARLFDEIRVETENLSDCKILVDLTDGACEIDLVEIEQFAAMLPLDSWPADNKIAFVSAPQSSSYHRLYLLRSALAGRGLVVGVFINTKVAIDWLAGLI